MMRLHGNDVALVGVFAALIIVMGFFKLTPLIGATSYQFSLGSVAIHVAVILLGPVMGGLATLIGSSAGQVATGQGFAFPMFIPATIGALVTGLLVHKRIREGAALLAATIAAWYLLPVGREAWMYPYLHFVALGAIVATSSRLPAWMEGSPHQKWSAIALCCTAGLLCDHLVGSIIAYPIFGLTASMYEAVLFIYPVERIMLGIASATIVIPVMRTVSRLPLSIIGR